MSHICEEFRRDLALEAAGELAAESREELGRHVAGCVACRDERDKLQATLEALRELPDEVPPRDITAEVMRDLPRARGLAAAYRTLGRGWRAAAAAVLVVSVGLGVASATKLKIEAENGRLVIGFGAPGRAVESSVPAPWLDDLAAADSRLADAFELRLSQTEAELSREVTSALTVMYQDLQSERREDLSLIGKLIVDGHRRDVIQGTTDELFVATLAKLSRAEPRDDEGAIDEDL